MIEGRAPRGAAGSDARLTQAVACAAAAIMVQLMVGWCLGVALAVYVIDDTVAFESELGRNQPAPVLAERQDIYTPRFLLKGGSHRAGTAFLARVPGCHEPLVLTAFHLFGPAGGVKPHLSEAQLVERLEALVLRSDRDHSKRLRLKAGALALATEVVYEADVGFHSYRGAGDAAAIRPEEHVDVPAFALARDMPEANDSVWLVHRRDDGEGIALTRAVVHGVTSQELGYTYTARQNLRATSGAPVINARGEVVAINVGGWWDEQQQRQFGYGNPVAAIAPALRGHCPGR